jgi:hypothetical protein
MEKSVDVITPGQVKFMILVSMTGCFSYNCLWMMRYVGNAIYVSVIVSAIFMIPFIIWFLKLVRGTHKFSIFDLLDEGTGKIVSKVIIGVYYFIHIALAVSLINIFCQMVKIYFIPNTPFWFIVMVILFNCALIANSDIKVLVRFCFGIEIIHLVNFFSGYALGIFGVFEASNLMPVFDTTFQNFIWATMFSAGNICECILMLGVLTTSIPDLIRRSSIFVQGVMIMTMIYVLGLVVFLGVIPKELLVGVTAPVIAPSMLLRLGDYLTGFEIFLLGAYQLSAISKIVVSLYCMKEVSMRFFECNKNKLFLGIATVIIFIPTLWLNSFNKAYLLSVFIYQYILLPFSIFILLLASLSSIIINRRKRETGK